MGNRKDISQPLKSNNVQTDENICFQGFTSKFRVTQRSNISYSLILLLSSIIGGGNIVIATLGKSYFSPLTFALLRWGVALLALTPFVYKNIKRDYQLLIKYKMPIILMSLTGIVGFNTIMYFALHFTSPINVAIIDSLIPLVIATMSYIILKTYLGLHQTVGITISIIGILFVLSEGSLSKFYALSFNIGDILALISVICWGVYSILIKKYAPKLPMYSYMYLTILIGVLILLPLAIWEMNQPSSILVFNQYSLLVLLYVGVLASLVATICWIKGVSKVGPSVAGVFINLVPVFSIIFSVLFLKQKLMWYQIVGCFIVVLGVVCTILVDKHNSKYLAKA